MKKIFSGLLLSAAAILISNCSNNQSVTNPEPHENKSVTIAIVIPDSMSAEVSEAYCMVTAPDMNPIKEQLHFDAPRLYGSIEKIPCGKKRLFTVNVYASYGSLLYTGEAYADIFSAETTVVKIILRKPGGTAEISGVVEDMDQEVIDTPSIITIADYYSIPTGLQLFLETSPCASSLGHEIIYRWDLVHVGTNNWVGKKSYSPACSLSIQQDGEWLATVTALCIEHPDITSESQTLIFTKSGDTITLGSHPNKDTEPPVINKSWADTLRAIVGDTLDLPPGPFTVIDNYDGDISSEVLIENDVLWHKVGSYTYSIASVDKAGNYAIDQTLILVDRK